jgi:hypothetical protein
VNRQLGDDDRWITGRLRARMKGGLIYGVVQGQVRQRPQAVLMATMRPYRRTDVGNVVIGVLGDLGDDRW